MFSLNYERVLALSPHTDDVEFGCGGTLNRLADLGCQTRIIVFSNAKESLPEGFGSDTLLNEQRAAAALLGPTTEVLFNDFPVRRLDQHRQDILELLVAEKHAFQPSLVLAPALGDIHQDHNTVAMEALRAFKDRTLLGYELAWNNISFSPRFMVKLSAHDVERKQSLIRCYESQRHRPYANMEMISGLARMRGATIGVEYAEAFEIGRMVAY